MTAIVPAAMLESIYRSFGTAYGADDEEARAFSACLLRADLRGHSLQGAALIPYYDGLLSDGQMRFGAPFEVLRDGPSTVTVDGHFGVGQVIGTRSMTIAMDKAASTGIGCVTVRRSGDFAMAAAHAVQALDRGMIGVAMSNGKPLVAPWGGRDAMLCTNPLSVAFPGGERPPVVIDMATSAFSMGQTVRAARDGRRLSYTSVVDPEGVYGDDPTKIVVDPADRESSLVGAMLPLGPKGFCLMLIVELLCGALAGSGGSYNNAFEPSGERPWDLGQVFMAISVEAFAEAAVFSAAVDELTERLANARPAAGTDGVRIPGDVAAHEEERRRREGVPLRDEEWELLRAVAERHGALEGLDLAAVATVEGTDEHAG
jgi:LDH2 family malate/lactate/ureidoglycolate dehydrogenase